MQNKDLMRDVVPVSIEKEMQQSYLDYAMSVIVSRALPDCRDGLKPVHRRILYAMYDTGNDYNKPYRKSSRVVGEVMGKYHPHGDSAIYAAVVRMAQDFSLRATLIDGQGNFGSIDGDSPAHMRYTEVRLTKISNDGILQDLGKETVDFQDNYDGSEQEPKVLPARLPNLLVNGSSGIAVGMATNIPTHNVGEVIDACCAYLANEGITVEELVEYIPAPDFPGGGKILGRGAARTALCTGRGSVMMRGTGEIEVHDKQKRVVITELPYQVNKAEFVRSIEILSKEKKIDGITEVRDETNKLGMRVAIDIRRDVEPEVVLNQLYRNTQLQTSFGVNMLALRDGMPVLMNVLDIIKAFIEFREEVVTRRTTFFLNKCRDKAHILIGLLVAVNNIDEIIALIRQSKDVENAKAALLAKKWNANMAKSFIELIDKFSNEIDESGLCYFTETQVKAILEMRLQRLTNLEYQKIIDELDGLVKEIARYLEILGSRTVLKEVIKQELIEIKDNFSTPRKTQIEDGGHDIDDESLIQQEDMVVTITRSGYIKRTSLISYKTQRRGGKGRSSMNVDEDDMITDLLVVNTHDFILFFSNIGRVYRMKVHKLPVGSLQSKGRAIINLLALSEGEKITNVISIPADSKKNEGKYLIFATSSGKVRRNRISDFDNIQSSGKIAIKLAEKDNLVGVVMCDNAQHVLLATAQGKAVRFPVEKLRVFKGRSSEGIRGVRVSLKNDYVVSISILNGIRVLPEIKDQFLKIDVRKRIILADLLMKTEYNFQYSSSHDNKAGGVVHIDGETKVKIDKAMHIAQQVIKEIPKPESETLELLPKLTIDNVLELAANEQFILTVNSAGYGKRTSAYEYRVIGRGGQGITNMNLQNAKTLVVSSFPVYYKDEIIVLTHSGMVIRTPVNQIRIIGRSTVGVRIIDVKDSAENVVSVNKIPFSDDDGEGDSNTVAITEEKIDEMTMHENGASAEFDITESEEENVENEENAEIAENSENEE